MGASPWMATPVALLKVLSFAHSGQFGSVALCGELQFAHQMGGWVQVGSFLQVERVHGCSQVLWEPVQTAQQDVFRQSAAGCP